MTSKAIDRLIVTGEHLYQPPRDLAHAELSHFRATPDGINWTARITKESYAPQVDKHVFKRASFDAYGSLRQQLDTINPAVSRALRQEMRERGVGDPFIHPILPDLNDEDKQIVIGAGYAAFLRETGQKPQWFWAPETALDTKTLETLAPYYAGVIGAPEQLQSSSGQEMDNQLVQLKLPSGRQIYFLPFDRPVSQQLAFHPKTKSEEFRDQIIIPRYGYLPSGIPLIPWTDGETFGHHCPGADDFLAYTLFVALEDVGIQSVSINSILQIWKGRPLMDARLRERSAWSCPHGDLVRWHGHCGCTGYADGHWKGPFYAALHRLNTAVTEVVRRNMGAQFVPLLIDQFPELLINPGGRKSTPTKSLLSAKASSLTTLTSCGTFFDNPHTAGHINVAFGLQAVTHLRDAGLLQEADDIWQQFENDLAQVWDPTEPGANLSSLPRKLVGDKTPVFAVVR